MRHSYHVLARVAILVLVACLVGCSTWRGARLYHSGSAALARGEIPVALVDLSRAARLVPQASEIHNHLGIARLEAGELELARASFERAVELDCDNRAASANLERLEAIERMVQHE